MNSHTGLDDNRLTTFWTKCNLIVFMTCVVTIKVLSQHILDTTKNENLYYCGGKFYDEPRF